MLRSVSYLFVYKSGIMLLMIDNFTDEWESEVYRPDGTSFTGLSVLLDLECFLAESTNPNVKALYVWDNWE